MRQWDLIEDRAKADVIDTDEEIQKQIDMEKAAERIITADNMTYEDFIDKYLDHIEGRAPRDSRPYTADTSHSKDREPTPPTNKRGAKAPAPKEEKKAEEEGTAEEEEEEKEEKQLEANMSRVTIHTTKSEKE